MKGTKITAITAVVWMSISALALYAQGPLPPPSAGGPIDGGVLILVIGAAALGYKKMNRKNAEQISTPDDK